MGSLVFLVFFGFLNGIALVLEGTFRFSRFFGFLNGFALVHNTYIYTHVVGQAREELTCVHEFLHIFIRSHWFVAIGS